MSFCSFSTKFLFFFFGYLLVLKSQRRRDRINEKMRALQELIPNCNKVRVFSLFSIIYALQDIDEHYMVVKVDKASMLDEAIEYLKSLQLQVQVTLSLLSETLKKGHTN